MSIPLVQNNEKDSINTSIIAIKKNIERINSILGLVDSGSDIDTSEFVKKSDIVDVVQTDNMNPVTSNAVATSNAMPVDTVTSGDMHAVTSNAVALEIGKIKIVKGSINTDVTIGANSNVDVNVYVSDLGFTPTKVVVQLFNRMAGVFVQSVSPNLSSTVIPVRLGNNSNSSYTLARVFGEFTIIASQ